MDLSEQSIKIDSEDAEQIEDYAREQSHDTDMYHDLDIQILMDDDCPMVSVLIPTYNRRKFLPLMVSNLRQMDYPKDKIEVCVIDDGAEPLIEGKHVIQFSESLLPIKFRYQRFTDRHLTIGEKRNKLVKMATHKICANMDDDDLYMPTYLRYAISVLLHYKVGIVHSPQMIFCYPNEDFKTTAIVCEAKRQGHEATQVFTKKHFSSMGGYTKNSRGEGAKMVDFNEKNCRCLDVRMCMMCMCHNSNTIDKDLFNKDNLVIESELSEPLRHLILSCVNPNP